MVTAAVVQSGPGIPDDIPATNDANIALVREAAGKGANLIQLAELATTPYFPSRTDLAYQGMAEALDGEVIGQYRDVCQELGVHLVLPFFEREGDNYYNSACIIDDRGNFVTGTTEHGREVQTFKKVHLPASYDEISGEVRSDEKRCFTAGDATVIFETALGRLGILICWDKRFTELWRTYMLRGAEIICNPICTWGTWRDETYPLEVRVMALYNQAFVLGGSKSGEDPYHPGRTHTGGSHIAGPQGEMLASLGATKDGIVLAGLDLSEVAKARQTTPILRDRRPDKYGYLTKDAVDVSGTQFA